MTTGKCRHCMYEPVAREAVICPRCAGRDPNPVPFLRDLPFIIVGLAVTFAVWGALTIVFLPSMGGFFGGSFVATFLGYGIRKLRDRVVGGG